MSANSTNAAHQDHLWQADGHILSELPPLIAAAQDAFGRDLPELLEKHPGQWVAYRGATREAIGGAKTELYRECFRRGMKRDEFIVRKIMPDGPRDAGELRDV